MTDFAALRERMVQEQIARRGIADPAILDAFRAVPREEFVPADLKKYAYDDGPLPIGSGQTISQPYIVALMIEAAEVKQGDRVLEVGGGSGYAVAVMSLIAAEVVAIERQPELAAAASERLHRLGYDNGVVVGGDGTKGWPDRAPYDAILAAAAGERIPEALLAQLKSGGRLVMPVGSQDGVQTLVRLTRHADGSVAQDNLGGVRFVPLIDDN